MKISPARVAAFEALRDCEFKQMSTSDLLASTDERLTAKDAGLCREIVLGVLRKQMFLDAIIRSFAGNRSIDPEVNLSLRIGAFQQLSLDRVPAYAAISESVELVRRYKKGSAATFVNAVLRKLQRGVPELEYSDDIERLAIETSHPRQLIEKWVGDHGFEAASAIALANNERPTVAFRTLCDIPNDELSAYSRSSYVENCYLSEGFNEQLLQWMRDGNVYVQDEGSQIVASLVDIPERSTFLDLCAAPGGKTGLVATRQSHPDRLIVAADSSWRRLNTLQNNLEYQNVTSVRIVQLDGTSSMPFDAESFDRILVDAPCTGTGTIRHNPEIKYRVTGERIAAAKEKQLKLLRNSSKLVRKGGKLTYSTCSLEPEENEQVAGEFLAENKEFVQLPASGNMKELSVGYAMRTWPHRDGMDGFFAAIFVRL
ncbi:MAG: methyltransferase [Acidobacteriota bacterium]|nr:MAG: methyltransferase [Acidobacteriota bacterium]